MFRITPHLATHGLGESIYPMTADKLETGIVKRWAYERWIVVDVRDMVDAWNAPIKYAEKMQQIAEQMYLTNHVIGVGKGGAVPKYDGVLVCCGAGMSRSNAVALGYLVWTGINWETAWKMVHAEGSIAQIEPGHIKALRSLFGIKDMFAGKELEDTN